MYSDVSLFIDGTWGPAAGGRTIDVVNPATGDKIGTVAARGDLRPRSRAGSRRQRFPDLAQSVRL